MRWRSSASLLSLVQMRSVATEHAVVGAGAARGAGLDLEARMRSPDPVHEFIDGFDLAMPSGATGVGRVEDVAVRVPLEVGEVVLIDEGVDGAEQVVGDLGAHQIEHQLVAGQQRIGVADSTQSGWARNRSESGFTISGSIHRPKSRPRSRT